MFRRGWILFYSGRSAHLSITGRPFSQPVQEMLRAFVAANPRLTSQYWITHGLAESLGICMKPDETPCTVPRKPTGASPADGAQPLTLFNAEQSTQPSMFGPGMCRQQRIPVSHHNKVVTGEAFSALRAAMMKNGIYSPYWIPREMAEQCLGLTVAPTAGIVSVGGLELVSAEHTSDSDFVRKVIVAHYVPHLLSTGAEVVYAQAYFTLKATCIRRRQRSEFWARKEELAPRLLQLDTRQCPEPVSVSLAEREAPVNLYNLDDTMPLERRPEVHLRPVAQQSAVPFDEHSIEPPDDIDSIPLAPTFHLGQQQPELPPALQVPPPIRSKLSPVALQQQQQQTTRRPKQTQQPPSAGRGVTSLLRPQPVSRRDIMISVDLDRIDDGTVDFVHDSATRHVFLVLRNGEVKIDLTSVGIHVAD